MENQDATSEAAGRPDGPDALVGPDDPRTRPGKTPGGSAPKLVEPADLYRIPAWTATKLLYATVPISMLFRLATLRGTLDSLASPLRIETRAALERHLGATTDSKELGAILRRHFQFRRRALLARVWPQIRGFAGAEAIEIEGLQHLDEALAAGRGAILVSAHFGHARLIKPILRSRGRNALLVGNLRPGIRDFRPELHGLPGMTRLGSFVQRVLRLPEWSRFDPRGREMIGIDLPTEINVRPHIAALARNEVVVILADGRRAQALRRVSVLGVGVHVAPGALSLARATGARLLPTFVVERTRRKRSIGLRLVIHPPLDLQHTDDAAADLEANLERFAAIYEEQVRARPHLWYWHSIRNGTLVPMLGER